MPAGLGGGENVPWQQSGCALFSQLLLLRCANAMWQAGKLSNRPLTTAVKISKPSKQTANREGLMATRSRCDPIVMWWL